MIKKHRAIAIAGKYAHRGEAIKLLAEKGLRSDFLVSEVAAIYKEHIPTEEELRDNTRHAEFEELRLLLDFAKGGIKILR